MKKTMRFLSLAALALVGAIMTGCSNKDDVTVEPENKSNVVTLTTTVGIGGGAETRALAADGTKTFAAGETMAVIYKNTSGVTVKAVSAALVAGNITGEGKSATFTFTLEDPNKGQDVTYIYPAAMAGETDVNYSALNSQNGSLATLSSDLDLATYSGAWDGASLPSATLTNQLAILAITLKNSDGTRDITSSITGLTITQDSYTYTITRDAAEGPIYVAIIPTSNDDITITATDGSTDYTKSLTGKTYELGNVYPVIWRMAPAAAGPTAYTLAESTQGMIVGTDGKAYAMADKDNLPTGVTAAGVVAYKDGTSGLVIALTDEASTMDWSTACGANGAAAHTPAVEGQSWKLPSQEDWQHIGSVYNGTDLNTAIVNAGGTAILTPQYNPDTETMTNIYWLSTENPGNTAQAHFGYIINGYIGAGDADHGPKTEAILVRAVLAF